MGIVSSKTYPRNLERSHNKGSKYLIILGKEITDKLYKKNMFAYIW